MATQSTNPGGTVTVFRDGLLPEDHGRIFAAGSIADSTHLPAGTASSRSNAVTVVPGGEVAAFGGDGEASLLCVTAGQLRLEWGSTPERVTTATAGDTVLVPSGISCRVRNASAVEPLQFVRVRSG